MDSTVQHWIILILYLLTSIIAVVGNAFICVTIYRKGRLSSTTYLLIFNMAISDILGGIVIPAQWLFCSTAVLDSGSFGQTMCGLMRILQTLSYYVSSLSIATVAYDRYKLVCQPTARRRSAPQLVTIVWVQGCIFCCSAFFSLPVSEYFSPTKGLITCRVVFAANVGYTFQTIRATMLILTQYLIPLTCTAICYTFVMRRVWSREQLAGTNSEEKQKKFKSKKKQTIIMLIVVTILFALSYLPTHIFIILKYYTKVIPSTNVPCNYTWWLMVIYWFGISSCTHNPFIYCYFNTEFRREAARYWRLIFPYCLSTLESGGGAEQSRLGVSSTSSTEMATTYYTTTTTTTDNSNNNKIESSTATTVLKAIQLFKFK